MILILFADNRVAMDKFKNPRKKTKQEKLEEEMQKRMDLVKQLTEKKEKKLNSKGVSANVAAPAPNTNSAAPAPHTNAAAAAPVPHTNAAAAALTPTKSKAPERKARKPLEDPLAWMDRDLFENFEQAAMEDLEEDACDNSPGYEPSPLKKSILESDTSSDEEEVSSRPPPKKYPRWVPPLKKTSVPKIPKLKLRTGSDGELTLVPVDQSGDQPDQVNRDDDGTDQEEEDDEDLFTTANSSRADMDKMTCMQNLLTEVNRQQEEDGVEMNKVQLKKLITKLKESGQYPGREHKGIVSHATRQKKKIKEGIESFKETGRAPDSLCNNKTRPVVEAILEEIIAKDAKYAGKIRRHFSGQGKTFCLSDHLLVHALLAGDNIGVITSEPRVSGPRHYESLSLMRSWPLIGQCQPILGPHWSITIARLMFLDDWAQY